MKKSPSNLISTPDLFNTPNVVHEVVVEQKQSYRSESSQEEAAKRITFARRNREHKDGRIYGTGATKDNYYACTVSPYFEEFRTQIEKGILPLVDAFRAKGYLTCSSCYGHPKRATLILCFPSDEVREEVIQALEANPTPSLLLNKKETVANNKVMLSGSGKVTGIKKDKESDTDLKYFRNKETKSFNHQFLRNYSQYSFLELVLFEDYHLIWRPFKAWETHQHLKNKDAILASLTEFIASERFPRFQY